MRSLPREQYFRKKIIDFYLINGRTFFWRTGRLNPFPIMVTELLLKKTCAKTVNQKTYSFIKKYNTNEKLMKARKNTLLKNVSILGLGDQRTRALHELSNYIHENFKDEMPSNQEEILRIPHVGDYIANATLCFGFDKKFPILDVNSSRIIARFFSIPNDKDLRDNTLLHDKAKELVPRKRFKEYNWGLLDLGAMVCKKEPVCYLCLLKNSCNYGVTKLYNS